LRQKLGIKALCLGHKLGVVNFCLSLELTVEDFRLGFELGVVVGGHPKVCDALQQHHEEEKADDSMNAGFHCVLFLVCAVHVADKSEWPNDSLHRVAAGGCSKTKKPAGRNSAATLCDIVFGIPTTALI